jgi:hypothetical protein
MLVPPSSVFHEATMPGWYELHEQSGGAHFMLRSPGGAVLLVGTALPSSEAAMTRIKTIHDVLQEARAIDRRLNERWEPYFAVRGADGADLATSPPFVSTSSRELAIEATRLHGRSAEVRMSGSVLVGG